MTGVGPRMWAGAGGEPRGFSWGGGLEILGVRFLFPSLFSGEENKGAEIEIPPFKRREWGRRRQNSNNHEY